MRQEFQADLANSIQATMAAHNIDFMPSCADLGDFDATSTTIALAPGGAALFWGEAGHVSPEKLRTLAKRYRSTHFALARWDARLESVLDLVSAALHGVERSAPFDLLCFPADSAGRFIVERTLRVDFDAIEWRRLGG